MRKQSPFRYMRAALDIQTAKHSQRLVLLALAIRMNSQSGTYFARYEQLQLDTGLSRKHLCLALEYLRDVLKILIWKKGHSGLYGDPKANLYSFNWSVMANRAEEGARQRLQVMEAMKKRGPKDTPTTVRTEAPIGFSQECEKATDGQDDWPSATANGQKAEGSATRDDLSRSILPSKTDESYIPPSLQVARAVKAQELERIDGQAARSSTILRKVRKIFEPDTLPEVEV